MLSDRLLSWVARALLAGVFVAFGAFLMSLYYAPRVDALNERIATLTLRIEQQNAAVARWQQDAQDARQRAQKALAEARGKAAAIDALRADLVARRHRDESCEDAAAAVVEQWRTR